MSHSSSTIESFHAGPHRLAVLLVCATFPLIWVGGLVTSYDAGMAVPDWPSTYGWNLFLYPWQSWLAGPWDLMIEHGHRLLGALVGCLAIGFVIAVFVWDRRRWMRPVAVLALIAVVAQGLLGGGRVLLDERQLAQLHGCLGPICFACFVVLAGLTSRWWHRQESAPDMNDLRLGTNSCLVVVLALGQLILGSQLRHIPTTASFGLFRVAVVFHVALALALVVYVLGVLWRIVAAHRRQRLLLWPALLLSLLLSLQLLLGAGSWVVKYSWPHWVQQIWQPPALTIQAEGMLQTMTVTAHVAVGSLILATSVLLALRVARVNQFVPVGVCRRSTWGGLVA